MPRKLQDPPHRVIVNQVHANFHGSQKVFLVPYSCIRLDEADLRFIAMKMNYCGVHFSECLEQKAFIL